MTLRMIRSRNLLLNKIKKVGLNSAGEDSSGNIQRILSWDQQKNGNISSKFYNFMMLNSGKDTNGRLRINLDWDRSFSV